MVEHGWKFDFEKFSQETVLIKDCLPGYEEQIAELGQRDKHKMLSTAESVGQSWKFSYQFVLNQLRNKQYQKHIHVVTLSELNRNPVQSLNRLFTKLEMNLGLAFSHVSQESLADSGKVVKGKVGTNSTLNQWDQSKTDRLLSQSEKRWIHETTLPLINDLRNFDVKI